MVLKLFPGAGTLTLLLPELPPVTLLCFCVLWQLCRVAIPKAAALSLRLKHLLPVGQFAIPSGLLIQPSSGLHLSPEK